MSTSPTPPATAADLFFLLDNQLQDRFDASTWRTVVSITDARPGRVWVLFTDGTCPIEDVADLIKLVDLDELAA